MKKLGFLLSMFVMATLPSWSQGARSIRITEVMTDNRTSIIDEYGKHKPWVEISNSSFTAYNVRGMFLTTDRSVLDPKMTPEQRRKLMSPIPNNETRTLLAGKKSLVLYDRSWNKQADKRTNAETGPFQLDLGIKAGKTAWVALYDGNAVDLIDSVSVPTLESDQSYELSRDFSTWAKASGEEVTPNYLQLSTVLSKPQMLKKTDPHGIGISVLSMGIVFSCLALLFIFFWIFGAYMTHKQRHASATATDVNENNKQEATVPAQDYDQETYMAVIALALQNYLEDKHDTESGIITIKTKATRWNQPRL